jgi:hypothetical protein
MVNETIVRVRGNDPQVQTQEHQPRQFTREEFEAGLDYDTYDEDESVGVGMGKIVADWFSGKDVFNQ